MVVKSYQKCAKKCAKKSRCEGYTWMADSGQCWLKKEVFGLNPLPSAVSGYCNMDPPTTTTETTTPPPRTCYGPFFDQDNQGQAFGITTTKTVLECVGLCKKKDKCLGYQWKKDSEQCLLKDVVGAPQTMRNSISGYCPAPAPPPTTP